MIKDLRNSLFILMLLSVSEVIPAQTVAILKSNNLSTDDSTALLIDSIHQKFPNKVNIKNNEIKLTIGAEALEKSLAANERINVATGITEAETLQFTREYPLKLNKTIFVLNQSGFKCQMDLFKNQRQSPNQALGILLKNETRYLTPFIKQYATQLGLKVKTWQIGVNESLADGVLYLMNQQDVIILLAKPEFNQSTQLNAMVQQAKVLNKSFIASSEYQMNVGISQGCIITNSDWVKAVIGVIDRINHHQQIVANYQLGKSLLNFTIIMPKITVIEK